MATYHQIRTTTRAFHSPFRNLSRYSCQRSSGILPFVHILNAVHRSGVADRVQGQPANTPRVQYSAYFKSQPLQNVGSRLASGQEPQNMTPIHTVRGCEPNDFRSAMSGISQPNACSTTDVPPNQNLNIFFVRPRNGRVSFQGLTQIDSTRDCIRLPEPGPSIPVACVWPAA